MACTFDGVPTPVVTWIQNSTIVLDGNDLRITVTTEGGVSILKISGVQRDSGGLYTCNLENYLDDLNISISTVLICECSIIIL